MVSTTGGSPSLARSRRIVDFTAVVNGSAISSHTRSSSCSAETTRPPPTDWLARVTPAAAFAVQQTLTQYSQVSNVYTPSAGYWPLAPWAGLTVLCAWAAVALGLAAYLLNRRDA
jgi:ABC-type transport system involved in multi-copper enzyme maturation permease subunit